MRYHHLGLVTLAPREGETYLPAFDVYASGFGSNPYGIEWLRYGPRCTIPALVRTVSHVAFEVDDLDAVLQGKKVIIAPNSPSPGVRVAFIEEAGAPVEFLQFDPGDPRSALGRQTREGPATSP